MTSVTAAAGRYQIVRELGSGAMAQVSLALDTRDRKWVALKRLHQLYALSGGARMRREFRALSSLNHPNIVQVYDHGDSDGAPYLALEFVDGLTLSAWLETPRGIPEIVRVFMQIAEALEAAHASGFIHRDLKPENIMVTQAGAAKLMDFGLTKLMQDSLSLTRLGAMVGTVLYMAPEQCRGEELDARADVYALGAVLYRALAGQAPFTGPSLAAVAVQHLSAAPRSLSRYRGDVPPALEALVMHMLAKAPEARPRSAREVAGRLRALLEPSAAPSAAVQGVRLLRAPLTGRTQELRTLEAALMRSAPGYVAVIGEAGMGKSRLLEGISTPAPLILASATASDTAAYAVIERLLARLRRDAPAVWEALQPEQRALLDNLSAAPTGDAATLGVQRFEAFRALVERAAHDLVLVLDNLHWADTATLSMLGHTLRAAEQMRLVVSYRPEELSTERPRSLPAPLVSLHLKALSPREMRALLEARLGGPTELGLREALLERANGNPWALDELLRDMIARDAILEQSGVFEWDRRQSEAGLLQHIGQRLQHLAPEARAFAETAAVLGREFLFEDARALLGWDDDRALGALEVLLLSKVLLERPNGDEFQFAHPEYLGWLEAQIEPARAQSLHQQALERLVGRAPDFALAQHALRAERFEQAFALALRAGEQALAQLHYALAERAFRLALEANVEAPSPLERHARFGLAEALSAIGQPEDACLLWQALSDDTDDLARRSRLQLAEWHGARGELSLALQWLRDDTSVSAGLARAKAALQVGDAPLAWREALSAYRQAPGNTECLLMLTNAANMKGQFSQGLRLARAAQARSRDSLVSLRAQNFEAGAYLGLREYGAAQRIYETIAEAAERIGHLWLHLSSINNIAIILFYENRLEAALGRYQQARALAKRIGDTESEMIIATNTVESLVMLGRVQEALELARAYTHPSAQLWACYTALLLGVSPKPLPPRGLISSWHQAVYDLVEAWLLLTRGDYAAALQQCETPHQDYTWWWQLTTLNARLALKLETDPTLEQLKHPDANPGIQKSLALEYANLLEARVRTREPLPERLAWLLHGGGVL